MRLLKFVAQRRGALRGFCDVELTNGLRIFGCPVLCSHGRLWVTLPARLRIDRAGRQVEVDGYRQFVKIMEWNRRELAEAFSAAIVALLREQHPDAFIEPKRRGATMSMNPLDHALELAQQGYK